MSSAFHSTSSRTLYAGVTVATFLVFTTGACLSFLATALASVGFDPARTGVFVSGGAIPVMVCGLLAGRLLTVMRARMVLILGILLFAAGYASLAWTSGMGQTNAPAASLAIMLGGMGLFMPAAFVLVRGTLIPVRLMQFVGIYGAMQLLPSLFGPTVAQHIFVSQGLFSYFLITSAPAFLAAAVLLAMPDPQAPVTGASAVSGASYLSLLSQFQVLLPCWGGFVSAAVFGAVNIFVVSLLAQAGTPIHMFFVPFVIAYLVARFLLLDYVRRLRTPLAAGLGIGFMALGVATLWVSGAGSASAVAAALQFGLGFSITYPVLMVWIASLFAPAVSARPVGLFNAIYTFGMYGSPLAGGLLLSTWGPTAFYICVVGLGLLTAAVLMLYRAPDPGLIPERKSA